MKWFSTKIDGDRGGYKLEIKVSAELVPTENSEKYGQQFWYSMAYRWFQSLPPSSQTPRVQISPSYEDTSYRDHHKGLILTRLQQRPYFQIGSHSEILEVDFAVSFEGMHFTP